MLTNAKTGTKQLIVRLSTFDIRGAVRDGAPHAKNLSEVAKSYYTEFANILGQKRVKKAKNGWCLRPGSQVW